MGLGLLRQRILIGKEPDLKSGDGRKATARSSRAAVATCPRSSAGRASDFYSGGHAFKSRRGHQLIEERNIIMTKEMVLTGLYARRNKLYRNGRNIKSPGVLRKIDRKIRQFQAAEE